MFTLGRRFAPCFDPVRMSTTRRSHAAADSAVGYYQQGLYALVLLLDANDGARVSVETDDDVVLEDGVRSLVQLKSSLGSPPALTIKNEGLWKTVKVWCDTTLAGDELLLFVTCAPLQKPSDLDELTRPPAPRSAQLLKLFDDEATRVRDERAMAAATNQKVPYEKRAPGCEAWLALTPARRQAILTQVRLVPDSFTAAGVLSEVENRLSKFVRAHIRPQFAQRLIQWWDFQVLQSMVRNRTRWLTKTELHIQIETLVLEHSDMGLPADVGLALPPDLAAEMSGTMARQIALVNGGDSRLKRAAIARWRARESRERWLRDNFAVASELDHFDRRLVESWDDRFGPMHDDCRSTSEPDRCRRGLDLLDWSHLSAPSELPPIRHYWSSPVLVQGGYQQLAEEQRVGWHPDFKERLASPKEV